MYLFVLIFLNHCFKREYCKFKYVTLNDLEEILINDQLPHIKKPNFEAL